LDLIALKNAALLPNYLVIPKVESRFHLTLAKNILGKNNIGFIALIETLDGIKNVEEIAGSSSQLCGLMFGAADYVRSAGGEICWDTLLFPRVAIVNAANRFRLVAIDTPYFEISDLLGLQAETSRVKKLGFTGRCAIHPTQIEPINQCFSYQNKIIEDAKKIVAGAQQSGGNICQIDGKMIGRPIIDKAIAILEANGIFMSDSD
jgi:(S)-citramalyl-CoA lyase